MEGEATRVGIQTTLPSAINHPRAAEPTAARSTREKTQRKGNHSHQKPHSSQAATVHHLPARCARPRPLCLSFSFAVHSAYDDASTLCSSALASRMHAAPSGTPTPPLTTHPNHSTRRLRLHGRRGAQHNNRGMRQQPEGTVKPTRTLQGGGRTLKGGRTPRMERGKKEYSVEGGGGACPSAVATFRLSRGEGQRPPDRSPRGRPSPDSLRLCGGHCRGEGGGSGEAIEEGVRPPHGELLQRVRTHERVRMRVVVRG